MGTTSDLISVLAPSRGRPEALQAMADSAHETAAGPIEVLAYVDDDDPVEYAENGVTLVRGPRITLSECWNRLAAHAVGGILHMASDDIRFRTPGWDDRVREAFAMFPDRIVFVHGRDGIHDAKLGTHGFVHRRWVNTVGYFTWGGFPCDYADTWLHEVADRIGRRVFLPSVLIEHLHPLYGKGQWDETHRQRLLRGREADVAGLWASLQPQRVDDAEKLEAACF